MREQLEMKLLTSAVMWNDKEKLVDLIATFKENDIKSMDAHLLYKTILKVYSTKNNCTSEELVAELLKDDKVTLLTKYNNATDGILTSKDYYTYKEHVKEKNNKEIIKKTLDDIVNRYEALTVDDIINNLDFKGYSKLEKDYKIIDLVNNTCEVMAEVEQIQSGDKTKEGLTTPYNTINKKTGQLQRGELVVITAEPSAGKSVIALDIALHNSLRGKNSIFFNLEMHRNIANKRIISNIATFDINILKHKMKEQEWKKFVDATGKIDAIKNNFVLVSDFKKCSHKDIYNISETIKKTKKWETIDCIVIDYLQYMTGNEGKTEYENLKENVKRIADYAKELNCTILLIASLNQQKQIEGAATIKYAADHIWFLKKDEEQPRNVTFQIAKNRNGELFKQEMLLMGEYCKFKERDVYV